MDPFEYDRLDPTLKEIRLLSIFIEDNGGISCELSKHSMKSTLEYRAVSYVCKYI